MESQNRDFQITFSLIEAMSGQTGRIAEAQRCKLIRDSLRMANVSAKNLAFAIQDDKDYAKPGIYDLSQFEEVRAEYESSYIYCLAYIQRNPPKTLLRLFQRLRVFLDVL